MKRYQVYLNPHSVSVLDDLEKIIDISRSKQLRLAVDQIAEQFASIVRTKNAASKDKHFILDELAGFVDLKTNKKINFVEDIDDIVYFQK